MDERQLGTGGPADSARVEQRKPVSALRRVVPVLVIFFYTPRNPHTAHHGVPLQTEVVLAPSERQVLGVGTVCFFDKSFELFCNQGGGGGGVGSRVDLLCFTRNLGKY